MFIVGIFSWWYGAGWLGTARTVRERLATVYDYFSIDLLLKTLFAPFRQISAGRVNGSIGDKMRAFFDRLLSRIIGACVRSIIMGIGIITLLLHVLLGLFILAGWLLLPLSLVAGIVGWTMGWLV